MSQHNGYPRTTLNIDPIIYAGGMALVAATGAIAGASVLTGHHAPSTVRYEHTVIPGDTMSGTAASFINESGGRIRLSVEELEPYMHTEKNPKVNTFQDPKDNVLQLGENVVADIPADKIEK